MGQVPPATIKGGIYMKVKELLAMFNLRRNEE